MFGSMFSKKRKKKEYLEWCGVERERTEITKKTTCVKIQISEG